MSAKEELISSLLPFLASEWDFGKAEFVGLDIEKRPEVGAHFASNLTIIRLKIKKLAKEEEVTFVVKEIRDEENKEQLLFFRKELTMYKEVLPALGFDENSHPKLLYGSVTGEKSDLNGFIFEDLKYKNFRNSKNNPFLDFQHISLAMKKLAKFHSLSILLKYQNSNSFVEIVEKLKIHNCPKGSFKDFNIPNYAAIERGVKAFEEIYGKTELMERFLKAMKSSVLVREVLKEPDEPFAVIIHGDFNNNNVLYKYDENGTPIDCAILDFQFSDYGSLGIDLAFFLYLNTDSEIREKHWDDFLMIYWQSLTDFVPSHIKLPSVQEFFKHFSVRAIFGYTVCSFFLPMMLDRTVKPWWDLPLEKQIQLNRTIGGKMGEEKILDVLSHMYNRKYIHAFLDYVMNNDLKEIWSE